VLIEVAEFDVNGIWFMAFRLDTGISQDDVQVSKCSPDLMTAALHGVGAGTARQMLVHEALLRLVKMSKLKLVMS
jgi:hypothetical protein